jgi:membrane protease YdiL (CAAX protease family)
MTMLWLFAVGVGLLIAFVAVGTVRAGLVLRHWTPPFNLLLSVPDNLARFVLIGLCVVLGVGLGPGPAVLGWGTAHLAQDLLWGALAGVLLSLALAGAGRVAIRQWGAGVYSNKMLQCILPVNRGEWIRVLLALLPAAALEELLFRSLPLGGLGWLLGPWWLLWPLSLFFGLLHWPQGAWGVVGATLAAVALSLLFLASGSIWLPLAAHYFLNMTQLALARRVGVQPQRGA